MQAEGISFSLEDKLMIAQHLDSLGVDYIEGGFPGSNDKEMQFFIDIARMGLRNSTITAFGSTRKNHSKCEDDKSLSSIVASGAKAATLFGKTWDLHVTDVLRCSLDENIILCSDSIKYLKQNNFEAIFDAEHFFDGYKNNPEYAMKVLSAVAEAGADSLVLCDTNGGVLPDDIAKITATVCQTFGDMTIGIHAHNDSGCATASSLAAVKAGVTHVQGTINGLGERCGNANLCEIVPNLAFKMNMQTLPLEKIASLTKTSRSIFEIANVLPVSNMPYVGESAFAHKAGLHVNALRKNNKTYEHIEPERTGNKRRILISELGGKAAILAKFEGFIAKFSSFKLDKDSRLAKKILDEVQRLEGQGYQFEAADASFELLVQKITNIYKPSFELIKYNTMTEKRANGNLVTEATVKLKVKGVIEHVVGEGDGPVNALDAALRKSLIRFYPEISEVQLFDYKVRVVNARANTAAKVRVIIESRDKDSIWGTVGVSENIIAASWQALSESFEYKIQKQAIQDKKKSAQ